MLSRVLPAVALTLLLCPYASGQQAAKPLGFTDDFATDSRPQYETTGDVGWQRGAFKLGKNAHLRRSLARGNIIAVTAVMDGPAREGEVLFRLTGPRAEAVLALRAADRKVDLLLKIGPLLVVPL